MLALTGTIPLICYRGVTGTYSGHDAQTEWRCLVTGVMRIRHRALQTPVVRFEHPKSGRSITVIGTIHIGTAAYYEQLRTMISEMESGGAVICYELVAPGTEQELAAASDEERAALDAFMPARPPEHPPEVATEALSRSLGWVDQASALVLSPSWLNVDMTSLEFVRRAGPQNLLSWPDDPAEVRTGLTQDQHDDLTVARFAVLFRLAQFAGFLRFARFLFRRMSNGNFTNVMFDERNRHVLASLPADSDAVLLWGAGHLPGFATGLRNAGYRRRDTTWVTVGMLPALRTSLVKAFARPSASRSAQGTQLDDVPPPPSPDSAAGADTSAPSVASE